MPRFRNGEVLVSDGFSAKHLLPDTRIEVFPNPASGWIRIRVMEAKVIETISLMDPAGHTLKQLTFPIPPVIDVSQIKEGLYILNVTLTDGESIIRKVIIQ